MIICDEDLLWCFTDMAIVAVVVILMVVVIVVVVVVVIFSSNYRGGGGGCGGDMHNMMIMGTLMLLQTRKHERVGFPFFALRVAMPASLGVLVCAFRCGICKCRCEYFWKCVSRTWP
mgnify:CR=1 FL=1